MKKWFKRLLLSTIVIVSIAFVLVYLEWRTSRANGLAKLNAIRERLNATEPGWQAPLFTDRRNAALPSSDQNIASICIEAMTLFPKSFDTWQRSEIAESLDNTPIGQQQDPAQVASLLEQWPSIESMIAKLKTTRSHTRGGHVLSFAEPSPLDTILENTQQLRQAAACLKWQRVIHSHRGRHDDAIDSTRSILHFRLAISDEPTAISQLVRMAITAIAVRQTEKALALGEPKNGLNDLQVELAKSLEEQFIITGFEGERALMDRLFENLSTGRLTYEQLAMASARMPAPPPTLYSRANTFINDRVIDNCHSIALDHITQARDALKNNRGSTRLMALHQAFQLPKRSANNYLVYLLLPALDKVAFAELRVRSEVSCLIAAIACERFRQAHGKWPDSLTDIPSSILPVIPDDPLSDDLVKLVRTEDGIVVYSVGIDGIDNKGVFLTPQGDQATDIGITLFDPNHRNRKHEIEKED